VDQVELVIWFLEHFGLPGYGFSRCADELVARYFSTPGLRVRGGPHRSWTRWQRGGASNAYRICGSVLTHREVYKTGRWTVRRADDTAITVEGMLPPRGFWLTPSRAEEIESYLAELPSVRGGHRGVATFTGHPVRLGDAPGRLERAATADGSVVYQLNRRDARRRLDEVRARPVPPIRAEDLATSIAEALIAASEDLGRWQGSTPEDDRDGYRAEIAAKRRRAAALTAAIESRFPQFDRGSEHYARSPVIREQLARASERNAAESDTLERDIGALESALAAVAVPPTGGFPIDRVLDFLTSLQNPEADAYRDLLRFALGPLQIDLVPAESHGGRTEAVRWTTTLTLTGPAGGHSVPVVGESARTGIATHRGPQPTTARVRTAVEGLRAGRRLAETSGVYWHRLLPAVRAALGADGAFHLNTVDDPRLLRLGMAVCYPPPGRGRPFRHEMCGPPLSDASLRRLAVREHEPVALLRRLRTVYLRPVGNPTWLLCAAPLVTALFAAANDNGGVVDGETRRATGLPRLAQAKRVLRIQGVFPDDWDLTQAGRLRLLPCRWCGHPRRIPLRLREADGAVCAGCRRDHAGVPWPADPYDAYRFLP
jgi:hypothetical protein